MEHLISNKDFGKLLKDKSDADYRRLRENFDAFLDKQLKLGFFVPCDENDVPLEKPKLSNIQDAHFDIDEMEEFHEAKQRVLFEGFIKEGDFINNHELNINIWIYDLHKMNIENLISSNLQLTEPAINQIYK